MSASPPFRLLGRVSSINVRKVMWTLGEIGIAYRREDWGGDFAATTTPDFLALNPNGLVPVLEVAEGYLWESNAICRYLAQRHGREDLLPADAWGRAGVEMWMDWLATELGPAYRYAFLGLVRQSPAYADPGQIQASVEAWNGRMRILEGQLAKTGVYVAGEAFTLADIVIGLASHRWLSAPMDRPDLPAVAAHYERLRRRPAVEAHGVMQQA